MGTIIERNYFASQHALTSRPYEMDQKEWSIFGSMLGDTSLMFSNAALERDNICIYMRTQRN